MKQLDAENEGYCAGRPAGIATAGYQERLYQDFVCIVHTRFNIRVTITTVCQCHRNVVVGDDDDEDDSGNDIGYAMASKKR